MLHALPRFVSIEGLHFIVLSDHSPGKQAMRDPRRRDNLLRGSVNLDAVAGGKKESLGAACFFAQNAVDRSVAGEALACLDIRGVMAEADAEKIHQREYVCERKVMPHSRVSAALKAMTQSVAIRRGAVVPR